VDGAIHPASAQQAALGRVHDGVHLQRRDVGNHDLDPVRHGKHLIAWQGRKPQRPAPRQAGNCRIMAGPARCRHRALVAFAAFDAITSQ
jgi:hypothetical protein